MLCSLLTRCTPATQNGIWTSKSGPSVVCFVHFGLRVRFAPHRCALFGHLNSQKWSERGVLCTFWLANVLRATSACTFPTSQLPKVVETVSFYTFDLEACFAPQRVQFLISHLARWLRTRRFSEPTFRPSRATNHWKNEVNRNFPTFSRTCIFFLLTFSSLIFSLFLFSSLTLHTSAFPSFHIVGNLTSKLPSTKWQ